ncbi:MAG: hypothetical protein R3D33_07540 [Hyphomicrobiaceae bacterium]
MFQQTLKERLPNIVAAVSIAFAIWRWWLYREKTLHLRLDKYILQSDQRLGPAGDQIVEALLRPGRLVALPQPTFAREISGILGRHWKVRKGVEDHVRTRLEKGFPSFLDRKSSAEAAVDSLNQQHAHLLTIQGALAVCRARQAKKASRRRDHDAVALRYFEEVVKLPGRKQDAKAHELIAQQLFRLGKRPYALAAYKDLERIASDLPHRREREMTMARASRFIAQIHQIEARGGSLNAYAAIQTALERSAPHAFAVCEWDALENVEMHYVCAYIAHRLNYTVVRSQQLDLAWKLFNERLEPLLVKGWRFSRPAGTLKGQSAVTLRSEAKRMRARLRNAKARLGNGNPVPFDEPWLGIENAPGTLSAARSTEVGEKPAAGIGEAAGQEAIGKAPEQHPV